jgi:hypothetical protein
VRDLHLEVQFLVQEVHGVVWQELLVQVLAAIFVTGHHIHVDLAIDLVICGHDGDDPRIIHHIAKTLQHVEGLSQQDGLLFLKKGVLLLVQLLEHIVLVGIEGISHHDQLILKLVAAPDVDLANFEIFNFYLNVGLSVGDLEV